MSSLPASCDGVAAPASSSVSFVAGGEVWAVNPDDAAGLHCLFPVSDPGLFSWGPRGDRVVLAGLQVRGVGTPLSRPAGTFSPTYYSWSRPTGTTVIFTDQARRHLYRADLGSATAQDISPVPAVTYGDMAYHPSGLAIGFVTTDASGSGIWMSTNTGQNPVQLVHAPVGTTFGHIVFAHDGVDLYYSVDTGSDHKLARYHLPDGSVAASLWSGAQPIADIVELAGVPGVALTVGGTCSAHHAVVSALDGTAGQPLAAGSSAAGAPVTVVGRLDADRFVLAAGGCGAPEDLWVAHASGAAPSLLVRGVTVAAMRQAEPTPAPPLPVNLPRSGFA